MATRKTAAATTAAASPSTTETTAPTVPPSSAAPEAYCVKCKTKRVITDPYEAVTNGRRMLKGTCAVCGTNMNRILGKA